MWPRRSGPDRHDDNECFMTDPAGVHREVHRKASRITYLYDTPGWALHNLGLMLQARLEPFGVHIDCVSSEQWHRSPAPTDCLYISYSGLAQGGFDYRRWAKTLVTTIHDPCEVSHFEDRSDWKKYPMFELPLEWLDRVSVISRELEDLVPQRYGMPVYRTPTWPTTDTVQDVPDSQLAAKPVCVAISSTILPEFFTVRQVLRRVRQLRHYTRDSRGKFSLAQLRGRAVRRRRKNVAWLRAIDRHFAGQSDVRCSFRYGSAGLLSRPAYLAQLHEAGVYVCTSTMEGGPLPVMEAVQAGLAVVSTPVGQVEEWVVDGVNGRICRTLPECIGALDDYRRNPDLLAAHRAQSRALALRHQFPAEAWIRFLTGD